MKDKSYGHTVFKTTTNYRVGLPEAGLPWQLDEALDLVAAVLAVVAAVATARQRDAFSRSPVPFVDRQNLG